MVEALCDLCVPLCLGGGFRKESVTTVTQSSTEDAQRKTLTHTSADREVRKDPAQAALCEFDLL
jgi:hypothetical protein